MAYTHPFVVPNGLTLDFAVQAADTAADNILGYNADGEITSFSSIPRSRISAGGNLTEATSAVLTITGGNGAILTSALTIQVKQANTSQSGYLSATDWNTFNNKISPVLNSAQLLVGNASNIPQARTITGDVTIDNIGVTAISAGVIVNADVSASAGIDVTKLETLTPSLMVSTNGSGFLTTVAGFTPTIAGFLTGITSAVQAQIDGKLSVTLTGVASGNYISYDGANWINVTAPAGSMPTGGSANQILRKINGTNYNTEWHTLVVADLTNLTSTVTELNQLTGVTTTTAQYNYINTLSSNAQTQINARLLNSLAQNALWVGDSSNLPVAVAAGPNGYVLTVTAGVPTWAPTAAATSVPLNGLTAAVNSNTINNAAYQQIWQWNTLGAGGAINLTSSSTAAASNSQTVLSVTLTGANGNATQRTFSANFTNAHTGADSTNVAAVFSSSGGTNNYAIITSAGNVGISVSSPTALLHLAAGTATAGTAPIKLNTGTPMTVTEDGAIEYHTSHLYFTIGSTRYQLDQQISTGWSVTGTTTITGDASIDQNGHIVSFVTGKLGIGTNTPGVVNGVSTGIRTHVFSSAGPTGIIVDANSYPSVKWNDQSQAADSRVWNIYAESGALKITPETDAGSGTPKFSLTRTGVGTIGGLEVSDLTTGFIPVASTNGRLINSAFTPALISGQLFNDFTDAGTPASGVETDLYTHTIAANTLSSNGDKIIANGSFIIQSAGGTIRVKLAGTTIATFAIAAGFLTNLFINVFIIREDSANARCTVHGNTYVITVPLLNTVSGLDFTAPNILKFTGQSTAGLSANDIVAKSSYIEKKLAA